MKTIISLLVLTFIIQGILSQPCLQEGITFTNQAEIDSFQINYPNCTSIEGDVVIGDWQGASDINNLNGLSGLTSFGGSVQIRYCDLLTSLTGLDNITSIGGDLIIKYTDGLTNLTGLANLTLIGGDLSIRLNSVLDSLAGLDNLTSIGENIGLYRNYELSSLDGLSNLESINGGIYITYNDALTSLTGIDNIDHASIGDLSIHDNASLSDCEVQSICDYLLSPNGEVNIYKNGYGCQNPAQIANSCGNTMSCLPFGNYYFCYQAEIDNFQNNYPGCSELMGVVTVEGYDITNLDSLIDLISIEGNLNISCINPAGFPCNPNLSSISGLANLTSIGGDLYLQGDTSLTSLEGLEELTSIGGSLAIEWNPSLTTLGALSNLININGGFYLGSAYPPNSNALTSLAGLENLTSIGNDFYIMNNPFLTSIQSLANTTSIGGDLFIVGNDTLSSLSGIENINASSINDLTIASNKILSTCEVECICDYLASPNGSINIHDNGTGCNSQLEVEEACESVDIFEYGQELEIAIFPNPATNEFTVASNRELKSLSVYNQLGQEVVHEKKTFKKVDISTLIQGIYIVELELDELKFRKKLIIK